MNKNEQRALALAARRALSAEERRAYSAAICERLLALPQLWEAGTILSYRALADEVDLSALEAALPARFAYPLCRGAGSMEARLPTGDFKAGPFGILEPDPARSVLLEPGEMDLVLTPCVAFDAQLRRLGHGAGYYDRYLPRCTRAFCIGVAFEAQRLERVITEAHDRRMDLFVTESACLSPALRTQ